LNTIETDYLVIGAGAVGLAFADTLIDETDAHVTIVDRHGKPGGHWNDAYSFVTLHQPSAFYGVNSMALGSGRKDVRGLNEGLYELASGPEVCGYFDRVMNHKLLPSGRVDYRPMSNWLRRRPVRIAAVGPAHGRHRAPQGRRRLLLQPARAVHAPAEVQHRARGAPGAAECAASAVGPPVGDRAAARYVMLGAGKTAMDTAIWLLQSGADPDAIQWVKPRDAWLINRVTTQPGPEFFEQSIGSQAEQMAAFASATGTEDLFARLEACGALLRIDPGRKPTMFHLATVSAGEVEVLRRIRQVIRLGRVRALEAGRMVLDQGTLPVAADTVFIDCTASAVDASLAASRPPQPIFQGGRIVLQLVRLPQPAFSAALLAWVEAHVDGDKEKNRLCSSVPFPHRMDDYARAMA
jgi:hypothetical protein